MDSDSICKFCFQSYWFPNAHVSSQCTSLQSLLKDLCTAFITRRNRKYHEGVNSGALRTPHNQTRPDYNRSDYNPSTVQHLPQHHIKPHPLTGGLRRAPAIAPQPQHNFISTETEKKKLNEEEPVLPQNSPPTDVHAIRNLDRPRRI